MKVKKVSLSWLRIEKIKNMLNLDPEQLNEKINESQNGVKLFCFYKTKTFKLLKFEQIINTKSEHKPLTYLKLNPQTGLL